MKSFKSLLKSKGFLLFLGFFALLAVYLIYSNLYSNQAGPSGPSILGIGAPSMYWNKTVGPKEGPMYSGKTVGPNEAPTLTTGPTKPLSQYAKEKAAAAWGVGSNAVNSAYNRLPERATVEEKATAAWGTGWGMGSNAVNSAYNRLPEQATVVSGLGTAASGLGTAAEYTGSAIGSAFTSAYNALNAPPQDISMSNNTPYTSNYTNSNFQ